MQIQAALDLYLVQLRADGRSTHTITQYERFVGLLARWLRESARSDDVRELRHEDIAHFLGSPIALDRADGTPKLPGTVNALRSAVRTFFGFCQAAGLTDRDPARLVRLARCGPPPPRGLSEREEERFVAALETASGRVEQRDRVLFVTMLRTGMRLGSALGLDVGHLDLAEGWAFLSHAKGGWRARVRLPEQVCALLGEHLAGRTGGPVFASNGGRRLGARQAQKRFEFWRERAGLPGALTPHSLRHTFAQRLHAQTGDVQGLAAALGHRSATSTLVYLKRPQGAY